MPSSEVSGVSQSLIDETASLSGVYRPLKDAISGWTTPPRVFADEWAASGSGCSLVAHGIEQRIADVIFDGALSGAHGMRWDLVVLGSRPAIDGDIEQDVILPAQAPRRVRVFQGVVQRVSRPWVGLALSEADIDSVFVGEGDA